MKKILTAALAVTFLATASTAMAAINLSRHDMGTDAMNIAGVVGAYGDCSACHLPHKAQGARLWLEAPTSYDVSYGTIGPLCARCHDGSVIQGTSADLDYGVFSAATMSGHGMAATNMPDSPTGTTGANEILNSSLPYTGGTGSAPITAGWIECTSCHDVHNSLDNRPFLAVAAMTDFCVACHSGRENAAGYMAGNANGLHPTQVAFATGNGTTGTANASPITTAYMSAVSAGTGLAADPVAWNSGGHVVAGAIDCMSCHAVHGDEPNAYAEDNEDWIDGGFPPTDGGALLFANSVILNDNGAGTVYHAQVCEYCHQGDNTNSGGPALTWPNPGNTPTTAADDPARSWHPVDGGLENGAGRLVSITSPGGFPFGGGTPAEVLCTSCHAAHGNTNSGGLANTITRAASPMLREDGDGQSFCQQCHDPATAANVTFDCFHSGHFAGGGGSTTTGMTLPSGGTNWGGTSAGLDCGLCHSAHNAPYIPILRSPGPSASADPDQICVDCHTVNPSTFTTVTLGTGTHFLGNPTVAGGSGTDWAAGNGYGVSNFTIVPEHLDNVAWGLTGAFSIYQSPTANKGGMVCLSCHTTGDNCGETTGINQIGDADATYMMLTASGNPVNMPATANEYLCSGCHGFNAITYISGAETGNTHPTGSAATIFPASGVSTATKTADGTMNCESCHRAHDADTQSGTYILEPSTDDSGVTGSGTATTVSPAHAHDNFCRGCHDQY